MRQKAEYDGILRNVSGTNVRHDYLSDQSHTKAMVTELCTRVKGLVEKEDRIIRLNSPVVIFGDLHGNLQNLLIFERIFFPAGPRASPYTFIFLGDYVDRGDYSLEVMCCLLSWKLQAPDSFILIRGNHEVRIVNSQFTFPVELKRKMPNFPEAFELFNQVFDCLPVAALIEGSVFCCHGGIPKPNEGEEFVKLADIARSPCPLVDPDTEYNLTHQLLWNDPVNKSGKFHFNDKRQTGFLFTEEATDNFLKGNNLTHVIRAHEVAQNGFSLNHDGKCVTVFSSALYDPSKNDAGVITIFRKIIRALTIETNIKDLAKK